MFCFETVAGPRQILPTFKTSFCDAHNTFPLETEGSLRSLGTYPSGFLPTLAASAAHLFLTQRRGRDIFFFPLDNLNFLGEAHVLFTKNF